MAIQSLPLFDSSAFRYRITLAGVRYTLRLTYAQRHGSWYLDLLDASGAPLRTGIRCVLGWPINAGDPVPNAPAGLLRFVRLDSADSGPLTREDFPDRVAFLFITGDDIPTGAADDDPLVVKAASP